MTDWQKQYSIGETPWDKGDPAPALLQYLASNPVQGRILVPGCGTGQDVRALAQAGAGEVLGLDIAPLAVERATHLLEGVPRASVRVGDLFRDLHQPPLRESFNLIWEHTCYCAIQPQQRPAYVSAVAAALKPGGQLLGVFFLNPWDEHEDQTQGPPFGTGLEELREQFALSFDLLRGWRPTVAYPGREGREWCGLFQKSG